jgi:hypothetical protein
LASRNSPHGGGDWRDDLNAAIRRTFFDNTTSLFRESPGLDVFTEHAQCLALVSDAATPNERAFIAQQWATRSDLTRCSLYFDHYRSTCCTATRSPRLVRAAAALVRPGRARLRDHAGVVRRARSDLPRLERPSAVPRRRQHRGHPAADLGFEVGRRAADAGGL